MDNYRRNQLYNLQPAEKAIWDAMQAVEAMPADVRLTLAGNRLKEAAELVADFIDEIPYRAPAACEAQGKAPGVDGGEG